MPPHRRPGPESLESVGPDIERIRALLGWLSPIVRSPPQTWIQENIDLGRDTTAARDDLVDLSLTPYLIDPINAWADDKCRMITAVAPEQTGKSSIWKWPLIWTLENDPGPALIVYPSDDAAAETNQDSVKPLMEGIPSLKRQLARPYSSKGDRYSFDQAVIYFTGAGTAAISKPCKYVVGDEVDFWITLGGFPNNIRNLSKRTRTFPNSKRLLCSTPTKKDGLIWKEFCKSSMGRWHLRCLGCGHLARSSAIHLLQWEYDDDKRVIPTSIRWICPECKREHKEAEAARMNAAGKYVHEIDDAEHRGYQWGALASPFISWKEIADAQTEAGRRADLETQRSLDNSFKGLPFSPRRLDKSAKEALEMHCAPYPDPKAYRALFLSADTQDNGWYWVVRAMDADESTWLMGKGFVHTIEELDEKWEAEYDGVQCEAGIIDEGGHRTREVKAYVKGKPGLYTYKGDARIGIKWKASKTSPKLILGHPHHYKGELLYLIYSQDNRDNNYWYLPEGIEDDYCEQIAAVKANPKVKHGDEFDKWEAAHGARDHYFDCERMALVIMDWARENFTDNNWRRKAKGASEKKKPKPRKAKVDLDW